MPLLTQKGIKMSRDFDIDFNIMAYMPPKSLRLLMCKSEDDISWKVQMGSRVNKFDILAVIFNDIPVYSPVSGVLKRIDTVKYKGESCVFSVIESDGIKTPTFPVLDVTSNPAGREELLQLSALAAIGDDYRKDYFKNILKEDKEYKKIILNCADDQPYDLTATAVMLNYENEVLNGLEIIAKAFGAEKEICIIKSFKTKQYFKKDYGDIKVLNTGGRYPVSVKLNKYAAKKHALIVGPETCRAVYRAVTFREPQTTKVVTAWGDALTAPAIMELPIGTPIYNILMSCGAYQVIGKIVCGGVMTGYLTTPYMPITLFDSSVTVLMEQQEREQKECINCGRCTEVCPVGLAPYYILRKPVKEGSQKPFFNFDFCIGCGCCSYVCPAQIPLKSYIKSYNAALKREDENEQS